MPASPEPARLRVGGGFNVWYEGPLKVFVRGLMPEAGPASTIGFRTFRPHCQVKEPTHGSPQGT